MRFALLLLFLLSVGGCGRKGPLLPPEALAPAAIQTLRVEQKGDAFFIAWSGPGKDIVSRKIGLPPRYRLYRREVLPPNEDCEECKGAYVLLKEVDAASPGDVGRSAGGFVYVDSDIRTGKLYQYVVTSVSAEGIESSSSNKARRKKVDAPPAPVLSAVSAPPGVMVEWTSPPDAPGATLQGFQIYRHLAGRPDTLALIYQAGPGERAYEDLHVEQGSSYVYAIRGVFTRDDEVLESKLSNTTQVTPSAPDIRESL